MSLRFIGEVVVSVVVVVVVGCVAQPARPQMRARTAKTQTALIFFIIDMSLEKLPVSFPAGPLELRRAHPPIAASAGAGRVFLLHAREAAHDRLGARDLRLLSK